MPQFANNIHYCNNVPHSARIPQLSSTLFVLHVELNGSGGTTGTQSSIWIHQRNVISHQCIPFRLWGRTASSCCNYLLKHVDLYRVIHLYICQSLRIIRADYSLKPNKLKQLTSTCNVTNAKEGLSSRDFGQLGGKEDFSFLHYCVNIVHKKQSYW